MELGGRELFASFTALLLACESRRRAHGAVASAALDQEGVDDAEALVASVHAGRPPTSRTGSALPRR